MNIVFLCMVGHFLLRLNFLFLFRSSHEIAHLRAEERLNSKKRPWERGSGDFDEVAEANGEEAEYTNREMYHRFR